MLRKALREMRLDMIKTAYFVLYLIAVLFKTVSDWIMNRFFDGKPLN